MPPLPIYVQPACAEEALQSWLLRLATCFKMSLHTLVSETFGIEDRAGVSRWWCRPDPWLLARISQRTGLHIAHVRRMTFGHLEPAYRDDEAGARFAGRWFHGTPRGRFDGFAACGLCLEGDIEPWLRTSWLIGWMALCPRHGTILVTQCAACCAPLRLAPFDSPAPFSPSICSRCGTSLFLKGKERGFVDLPGIGQLTWKETIALADVLVGMVWTDTTLAERDQIFGQFIRPSPSKMRKEVDVFHARHDSLSFLAWLLQGWPNSPGARVARDMLARWRSASREYCRSC